MNTSILTYSVADEDHNLFLRDILSTRLQLSHSLIVKLKHQNKVQANGKITRTNYQVQTGDLVEIDLALTEEIQIVP